MRALARYGQMYVSREQWLSPSHARAYGSASSVKSAFDRELLSSSSAVSTLPPQVQIDQQLDHTCEHVQANAEIA